MTVHPAPTNGSPRYIDLLADAATTADANVPDDLQISTLWYLFDEAWANLTNEELYSRPELLSNFASVGMALLYALTGTPIPRLALDAVTLHIDKNAGYAGLDNPDPWANFRLATSFGVSPFDGVLVRLSDKYIRTQNLRRDPDNERVGESLADTIRDAVAYALIARCISEETLVS